MLTTEEILNLDDNDRRHLERVLAKKVFKRIAIDVAWRLALVGAVHLVSKRIAKKIETTES